MWGLGFTEILILVAVLFLIFGARRLPVIGRSLGEAVSSFVKEIKGIGKSDSPELPPPADKRPDDRSSPR
jgi:sec-independent protein translocase protein TatA